MPASHRLLRLIASYPHYSVVAERVITLPRGLSLDVLRDIAYFLEDNDTGRIQYNTLTQMMGGLAVEEDIPSTPAEIMPSPQRPPRLMRSIAGYPDFSVLLHKVEGMPLGIPFATRVKYAEYLTEHPEIMHIRYDDLVVIMPIDEEEHIVPRSLF